MLIRIFKSAAFGALTVSLAAVALLCSYFVLVSGLKFAEAHDIGLYVPLGITVLAIGAIFGVYEEFTSEESPGSI